MAEASASGPVLLGYDGSDPARRAIEHAAALLGAGPAVVLTVWEPTASFTGYDPLAGVSEGMGRAAGFEGEMDDIGAQVAQRTAELTVRQQRDLAYGRALTALAGEGSLEPVLELALREAAAFSEAALIVCYRVSGQRMSQIAQIGLVGAAPGGTMLPLNGAAQEAFRSRRTVVLDPLPEDVELRYDAVLATGRPRAIALVPLLVGHRHVGLLAIGALKPFEPSAVTFLSDLAVPLALTIVRHDLHRQTNEFAEQLAKGNEELQLQTEELEAQRQDLEAKNLQIQKADQLKSEFLANMSHELRTPLNAIIGFSELLLEEGQGTLSPEHFKFVQDVLASGRHLLALINDILDLAKIEAGRIELRMEPLAPASAIAGFAFSTRVIANSLFSNVTSPRCSGRALSAARP